MTSEGDDGIDSKIPAAPTRKQYWVADEWPFRIWMGVIPLLFVVGAARECEVGLSSFTDLTTALWLCAGLFLAWLLGCFAAILLATFVLGPIYYDLGLKNGAPFLPGDRVMVLTKEHRGKVGCVYSLWQGDTVRVDIGEKENEPYLDIFAPTQLLRMPTSKGEP